MVAEIGEKRRLEDAMLLALAMEEGAQPEGCTRSGDDLGSDHIS